jgi:hypothetical protein
MIEHASHPAFPRVYSKVAEMSERRGGAEHRRKLLASLNGWVTRISSVSPGALDEHGFRYG